MTMSNSYHRNQYCRFDDRKRKTPNKATCLTQIKVTSGAVIQLLGGNNGWRTEPMKF